MINVLPTCLRGKKQRSPVLNADNCGHQEAPPRFRHLPPFGAATTAVITGQKHRSSGKTDMENRHDASPLTYGSRRRHQLGNVDLQPIACAASATTSLLCEVCYAGILQELGHSAGALEIRHSVACRHTSARHTGSGSVSSNTRSRSSLPRPTCEWKTFHVLQTAPASTCNLQHAAPI